MEKRQDKVNLSVNEKIHSNEKFNQQEIREVRRTINQEVDVVKSQVAKVSGNINKKMKMIKNGVRSFVGPPKILKV